MPYLPVHAPVYGYLKGVRHTITLHNVYFARTYSIMQIINNLSFSTLLNVGGAEGFHNYLFQTLFDSDSILVDLEHSSLKCAGQFFNIPAARSDGQRLPFKDNSFDVVTCIETIEHVIDPQALVTELKRVAKKFVLISTESYFESEEQKKAFLQYIRETHPQFFRRTDPIRPSDLNHFTKKDIIEFINSENIRFFPQYSRKGKDFIAPIEKVRQKIKQMTEDIPISRASRVIALFSHNASFDYLPQPRCTSQKILETIIQENPYFEMELDEEMQKEDNQTLEETRSWWDKVDNTVCANSKDIPSLKIDEEGSKGMRIKWITKDNFDASPCFCTREITIEPDGFTPSRRHEWEHQLVVLKGKGKILNRDGNPDIDLYPGMTVRIPPRTDHQIFSDSKGELLYLDIIPSITYFFGR